MFHPSEAGRDVDMQKEGRRGQAKRSFVSDVVSFLSRIFKFIQVLKSPVYFVCEGETRKKGREKENQKLTRTTFFLEKCQHR